MTVNRHQIHAFQKRFEIALPKGLLDRPRSSGLLLYPNHDLVSRGQWEWIAGNQSSLSSRFALNASISGCAHGECRVCLCVHHGTRWFSRSNHISSRFATFLGGACLHFHTNYHRSSQTIIAGIQESKFADRPRGKRERAWILANLNLGAMILTLKERQI